MGIVVSCVRGWAIAHVAWVRQLDNLESGLAELRAERTEQLEGLAELRTLQRGAALQLDALQRGAQELEARVSWLHQRLTERATRFTSDYRSLRNDVDAIGYDVRGISHRVDALHIRMHAAQSGSEEP